MEKAQKVVNYYVLCNKLKNVIRTGWKNWNVDRKRIESVAEHIFGVQSLAIAINSEYDYDIDIYKVIYMIAVHELEEIIIGDLTFLDIDEKSKFKKGHQAIKEILKDLKDKEEIEKIILEFDERKTKEALFSYHCDKLECDMQCKLYDEEGCVDLNQPNKKINEFENINNETTWSGKWLEFDRKLFLDDKNFIELLDYIKNNKIS